MLKDVILLAQVSEIRIRVRALFLAAWMIGFPNSHQLFGIRKRQRPQQHCIDDAEDCRVRTYTECQRYSGNDAEARRLEQHAYAVADVLPKIFHVRLLSTTSQPLANARVRTACG